MSSAQVHRTKGTKDNPTPGPVEPPAEEGSTDIFDNLASGYDRGMLPLEVIALRELRRRAFPPLTGQVLELGVGTGVNLPLYGREARIVALDLSRPMLEEATPRAVQADARLVEGHAQYLPFADGSFDVVTGSLIFCSVPSPIDALKEIWRTLKPAGRLVLVEHTRGNGLGAWLTDLLNPLWLTISESCNLNRETAQTIAEAGFQLVRVEKRLLGIFKIIEGVK